ncbi:hypothetical protein LINPERPRIM_LOCUS40513 [Linum perenne]
MVEDVSKDFTHSVHALRFFGVTKIKLTRLPPKFIQWASDHYDIESRSILLGEGRKFRITADDVRRVYGIPEGDKPICFNSPLKYVKTIASNLKIPQRSKKGASHVNLSWLKDRLGTETDVKKWRKLFMLFLFGGFLCPTSHDTANLEYLPFMDGSPDDMKNYKWCSHIADWFNDDMVKSKGGNYIEANIHLLLVIDPISVWNNDIVVGELMTLSNVIVQVSLCDKMGVPGEIPFTTVPPCKHWDIDTLNKKLSKLNGYEGFEKAIPLQVQSKNHIFDSPPINGGLYPGKPLDIVHMEIAQVSLHLIGCLIIL